MNESSVLFPNLGITLRNVGQSVNVFGFRIAYYGIVMAIAIGSGFWLVLRVAKKTGQNEEQYMDFGLIAVICSLIGARLYYVIFSWEQYRDHPLEIFNLRGGGLAIYGAVLAGTLTAWIYTRCKKWNFTLVADTACVGLALGQAIGRWGNFFNREVFGGYTDSLLAMALPYGAVRRSDVTQQMLDHMVRIDGVDFIQVHPTFLYESCWNLVLLLFLLWFMKRKQFHGEVFVCYLAGYGIGRAWIEGIRTDRLFLPGGNIPVSQALSVLLAAGSLIAIWVNIKRKKRGEQKNEQTKSTEGTN